MIDPMELKRLAVHIESMMHVRTYDWGNADEMEFKNRLPTGRDPRRLPIPQDLRYMADKGLSPSVQEYQTWIANLRHMEDLERRNDPRNPNKMMRDMARGRFPGSR